MYRLLTCSSSGRLFYAFFRGLGEGVKALHRLDGFLPVAQHEAPGRGFRSRAGGSVAGSPASSSVGNDRCVSVVLAVIFSVVLIKWKMQKKA